MPVISRKGSLKLGDLNALRTCEYLLVGGSIDAEALTRGPLTIISKCAVSLNEPANIGGGQY